MEAARRIHTVRGDLASDLAALGLEGLSGSLVEEVCEVWTCNWPTVSVFIAMQRQWRIGINGATGLDYVAVPYAAEAMNVRLSKKRWQELMIMEREALKTMDEQREANREH